MIYFEHPWLLYLLWTAPALAWLAYFFLRRANERRCRLVSPAMARRLSPASRPWRAIAQTASLGTGFLLTLIAAARPQWGTQDEIVQVQGRDLMIALDVSRSMLARDVHPNRLTRAKTDLLDLLKELRGDRVGLVVFRGKALQLCPLTTDYAFFAEMLDRVDVDAAPPGETSIGDGLERALDALDAQEGRHRAILLVSDGEDLSRRVEQATERARQMGVPVFTVGLGDDRGAPIPDPEDSTRFLRYGSTNVVSSLQHETLQTIAERTGGVYVPVGLSHVHLGRLYREHLRRIATRENDDVVRRSRVERYHYFLLPAVLALMVIPALSRGRFVSDRPVRPAHAATANTTRSNTLLVFLLLGAVASGAPLQAATNASALPEKAGGASAAAAPPASTSQSPRRLARQAQALQRLGRHEEAAALYREAARSASSSRGRYLFNAGCALLAANRQEEAADLFLQAAQQDDRLAPAAWHNAGCALHALAESENTSTNISPAEWLERQVAALRGAAALYQRTARADPSAQDARRNLAIAAAAIPPAEEKALRARLMAQYGNQPPNALADLILREHRAILNETPAAFTNPTPDRIELLETLNRRVEENANRLIPLSHQLSGGGPVSTGAVAVADATQRLRDAMKEAAEQLADLDPAAFRGLVLAEEGLYGLWKALASYEQILLEDLRRQSNAILQTTAGLDHLSPAALSRLQAEQEEAGRLTALFLERFESAVPNTPMAAAVPSSTPQTTNASPEQITPEHRNRILDLGRQALEQQQKAAEQISIPSNHTAILAEQKAYDLLKEIESLLPKPPPQPDAQPQQQSSDKSSADQQKQSAASEQEQSAPPEEAGADKEQSAPPEQEQQKEQRDVKQEEAERLIERALQRQRDYESERRRRERQFALPAIDRDW